jgi:hypothetical protein
MDPSADFRVMVADWGQPVIMPGGATVSAIPGIATAQDSLGGDSIVAGRTRTLKFVSADVPDLVEGVLVIWSGRTWQVNSIALMADGWQSLAFIGVP